MQTLPILHALRRHKLTAILLSAQVAFTCAVVCNATPVIVQRFNRIMTPSGLNEKGLSIVSITDSNTDGDAKSIHINDLSALQQLPGVKSAAMVTNIPFSGNTQTSALCNGLNASQNAIEAQSMSVDGCAMANEYGGGPGVIRALGLNLVAGRDFYQSEYVAGKQGDTFQYTTAVIISENLAEKLSPHNPNYMIGKSVYIGRLGIAEGKSTIVVGIVDSLQGGH